MKGTRIRHRKQKSAFETNRLFPCCPRAGQGVGTGPRPRPPSAWSGQEGQAPPRTIASLQGEEGNGRPEDREQTPQLAPVPVLCQVPAS